MRTYIHLHTPLPLGPVLKLHFFHSCTQILSFFSSQTSCTPPMALGPLETIKRYRLMKYRVFGFNFMVPITANCNMANYSSLCRIASAIVMPPSDEISSKWHLRGVNWAFHYFNYVDLWFTFADGENKAIWKSFVRLCFPHGYWIHLYSFPDVPICSKKEASEIDNTNNFSQSYRDYEDYVLAVHKLHIFICTLLVYYCLHSTCQISLCELQR